MWQTLTLVLLTWPVIFTCLSLESSNNLEAETDVALSLGGRASVIPPLPFHYPGVIRLDIRGHIRVRVRSGCAKLTGVRCLNCQGLQSVIICLATTAARSGTLRPSTSDIIVDVVTAVTRLIKKCQAKETEAHWKCNSDQENATLD